MQHADMRGAAPPTIAHARRVALAGRWVADFDWSPDARHVVCAHARDRLTLHDAEGGACVLAVRTGHRSAEFVRWSPCGRRIALVAALDGARDLRGTMCVLDVSRWRDRRVTATLLGVRGEHAALDEPNGVCWAPCGRRVALARPTGVYVWDLPADADADPRGGGADADGDAEAGDEPRVAVAAFGGAPVPPTLHLSPGATDGGVRVWEDELGTWQADRAAFVQWSACGRRITSARRVGTLCVWDARGGERVRDITLPATWAVSGHHGASEVSCSPDDGRHVLVVSRGAGGTEMRAYTRAALEEHGARAEPCATRVWPRGTRVSEPRWSPCGRWVVAAHTSSRTGTRVEVRAVPSAAHECTLDTDGRCCGGGVRWSPDGRSAAALVARDDLRIFDLSALACSE